MVNGDITVGDHPTDSREAPAEGGARERPDRPRDMCPAMAQQRSEIGNEAAPQQLIRLIGSCDSRLRSIAATPRRR
jgi:HEAT repeat protein